MASDRESDTAVGRGHTGHYWPTQTLVSDEGYLWISTHHRAALLDLVVRQVERPQALSHTDRPPQ